MITRDELIGYLDDYLKVGQVPDYGPMGLQVEGRREIRRIVTGVSASVALFEAAIEKEADLILVHHGILWDRDSRVVRGPYKQRLSLLLQNEISLLAYHLALDKHEEIGNNILAARALDMHNISPLGEIGLKGNVETLSLAELKDQLITLLERDPVVFDFGPAEIRHIGYCSGGAARDLAHAIEAGLDAYITGETSEASFHLAREGGIHFIAAGHHVTERLGIRALGELVAAKFDVQVEFVDIPNPV